MGEMAERVRLFEFVAAWDRTSEYYGHARTSDMENQREAARYVRYRDASWKRGSRSC